jgi:hypothetical protein
MKTDTENTTGGGCSSHDLLALLDSEIAQAQNRQFNLTRDAEIATVKNQIVGEYRCRFMDLRDKLRDKISEANETAHLTAEKGKANE